MTVPMPIRGGSREVRDGGVVAFGDGQASWHFAQHGRQVRGYGGFLAPARDVSHAGEKPGRAVCPGRGFMAARGSGYAAQAAAYRQTGV